MKPKVVKAPKAFKSAETVLNSDESDGQPQTNGASGSARGRKRRSSETSPIERVSKRKKPSDSTQNDKTASPSSGSSRNLINAKETQKASNDDDDSMINGMINENQDSVGSSGSSTSGESSSGSDSEDDSSPQEQDQTKATDQTEQTDHRNGPGARQFPVMPNSAFTYEPPTGFQKGCLTSVDPHARQLFNPDNLEKKQIWHIVAPKGVPISELNEILIDRLEHGGAALSHQGFDYQFVKQTDPNNADVSILVPDTGSKSFNIVASCINKSFHVRRLMTDHAPQNNTIESAQKQKPPVQQPTGLKKQYWPPGFEPNGVYPAQSRTPHTSSKGLQSSVISDDTEEPSQQRSEQPKPSKTTEGKVPDTVEHKVNSPFPRYEVDGTISRNGKQPSADSSDSSSSSDSRFSDSDSEETSAPVKSTQPHLQLQHVASTPNKGQNQPKNEAKSQKAPSSSGSESESSSSESSSSSDEEDDPPQKKKNTVASDSKMSNSVPPAHPSAKASSKTPNGASSRNPPFRTPLPTPSTTKSEPTESISSSSSPSGEQCSPSGHKVNKFAKATKKSSQPVMGTNGSQEISSPKRIVAGSQEMIPETPEKLKRSSGLNASSRKNKKTSVALGGSSQKRAREELTSFKESPKKKDKRQSTGLEEGPKKKQKRESTGFEETSKKKGKKELSGLEESSKKKDKKKKKRKSFEMDVSSEKRDTKKGKSPEIGTTSEKKDLPQKSLEIGSTPEKKEKRENKKSSELNGSSKKKDRKERSSEIGVDSEKKDKKKKKKDKSSKKLDGEGTRTEGLKT